MMYLQCFQHPFWLKGLPISAFIAHTMYIQDVFPTRHDGVEKINTNKPPRESHGQTRTLDTLKLV